jgi:hypothetical protein
MKKAGIPGICRNPDDWAKKLESLLNSKNMRQEFQEKAQIYLKLNHNLGDLLAKWDAVLTR